MEITVRLDPQHLDRFRTQAILKNCRQGKPVFTSHAGEGQGLAFRARRSLYRLGGSNWAADLLIEVTDYTRDGQQKSLCLATFSAISGPSAPVSALLQALAVRVPLSPWTEDPLAVAIAMLDNAPSLVAKAKPPKPAPQATNAEILRQVAAGSLAQLVANHAALREGAPPEAVHQMRVALRRLRSAMSLYRLMLVDPGSAVLRDEFRWLQGVLGPARDRDVLFVDTIAPLAPIFADAPGFARLQEAASEGARRGRLDALGRLAVPRFAKLMLNLACWAAEAGSNHPLGAALARDWAPEKLGRLYRRLRKMMKDFDTLDDAGRHQCRIAVKKLRYGVDLLGDLIDPKLAAKAAELLADMQDSLGRLNDAHLAEHALRDLCNGVPGAEICWAAGMVIGWHRAQRDSWLDRVAKDWRSFEELPPLWRG